MNQENAEINIEQEIELANQIYDKRAGGNKQTIVSKIGVKFSSRKNTANEKEKLSFYQNAHKEIIESWKVRKLFNLGLAEWLPKYGVAKVLKQGKFILTKGHFHVEGFVCLYPEEALFLLDVGDIELTYKNALLSMEDAYNLLLCRIPEEKLCTLDEYQVYSHLSRVGYRVQRYNHVHHSSNIISQNQSTSAVKQIKKIKLNPIEETESKAKNVTNNSYNTDFNYRNWWLKYYAPNTKMTGSFEKNNVLSKVHIPNFSCESEQVLLIEVEKGLLPSNTVEERTDLSNLWNMKINRCESELIETKLNRNDFSHPKTINYSTICREAKNWAHFSDLAKQAETELNLGMNKLLEHMNDGHIKPLITPCNSHSINSVLENLKYTGLDCKSDVQNVTETGTNFKIKFNVFQSNTVNSFRKTQPGTPLLRIVVCDSLSPYPTPCDMTVLNRQSNGVPVKFGLVTFGRALFFGFSEIDIPTLTN